MEPSEPDGLDQLATIMQAMGNPVRTRILNLLRSPHTLGEIHVSPNRQEEGARSERSMSRVSVRHHLEQLLAIGAVRQFDGVRDGRTVALYQINHRQLFALSEELRELGRIRPETDFVPDGTVPAPTTAPVLTGPRLILMNGAYEGKAYPLRNVGVQSSWSIGRRKDSDIALDYDPFLSQDNSQVRHGPTGFVVQDLDGNRNGTRLNWRLLARGGQEPLRTGDVIGVGRSQLLFRAD